MSKKTIVFNTPPAVVRAYVGEWLNHAKADKASTPAQIAVLEDLIKLCDVALGVLEPTQAEPGNNKQ